jgi:hypothetical protein
MTVMPFFLAASAAAIVLVLSLQEAKEGRH